MTACPFCGSENADGATRCGTCGGANGEPPSSSLADGTLIDGRYRISDELGSGGFGITYRGFDEKLRRPVAIKEMFPEGSTRRGTTVVPSRSKQADWGHLVKSFKDECQTLISLEGHAAPGLLRVHDVCLANQTVYMVTELLQGKTLEATVESVPKKRLPEAEVLIYAKQLCQTLEILHEAKVLHRDIKPPNVMIEPGGRGAVLIDFGSARQFTLKTMAMTVSVSFGYTPLEQYGENRERSSRYGPPTDIYSLGATLYYAAVGVVPTPAELRANDVPLPTPAQANPALSAAFSDAIMKAMERRPENRPQSARQFLSSLERLAGPAAPASPTPFAPAILPRAAPVQAPFAPAPSAPAPFPGPHPLPGPPAAVPVQPPMSSSPPTPIGPQSGRSPQLQPPVRQRPVNSFWTPPVVRLYRWLKWRHVSQSTPTSSSFHAASQKATPRTGSRRILHLWPWALALYGVFLLVASFNPNSRGVLDNSRNAAFGVMLMAAGVVALVRRSKSPRFCKPHVLVRLICLGGLLVVGYLLISWDFGWGSTLDPRSLGLDLIVLIGGIARLLVMVGLLGLVVGRARWLGVASRSGGLVLLLGSLPLIIIEEYIYVTVGFVHPPSDSAARARDVDLYLSLGVPREVLMLADPSPANSRVAGTAPGTGLGVGAPTTLVPTPPVAIWRVVAELGTNGSSVNKPERLALDSQGNLYVTDPSTSTITKVSPDGKQVAVWGGSGRGPGQFNNPIGITLDSVGSIYIADNQNQRVQKLAGSGKFLAMWSAIPGLDPSDLVLDDAGNAYVTSSDCGAKGSCVVKVASDGTLLASWAKTGNGPGQFSRPSGIAIDEQGDLYVVDGGNNRVQELSPSGEPLAFWGAGGTGPGQFQEPRGIGLDPDGNVYIVDTGNNRIEEFSAGGTLVAQWGGAGGKPGMFNLPTGITLDVGANIYVADSGNRRIQKLVRGG